MAEVRYCYRHDAYHAEGTQDYERCRRDGALSGSTHNDLPDEVETCREAQKRADRYNHIA